MVAPLYETVLRLLRSLGLLGLLGLLGSLCLLRSVDWLIRESVEWARLFPF